MTLNFDALVKAPRLLVEAYLKPLQGTRFRPTGFPNLGAADYDAPDPRDPERTKRMLLVESAASVTNWLERAMFKDFSRDNVSDELADGVSGIPYVEIDCGSKGRTSTLLESHRLNTPYIWESAAESAVALQAELCSTIGVPRRKKKGEAASDDSDGEAGGRIDMGRFYRALMKYDPNCLVHGVFLEKVSGRLRVPRALSGFIEAHGVSRADSGGTKFDHIFPAKDDKSGIASKDGYTNVPYPTTDFVAESIVAYFNLDLSQIRGYGLGPAADRLLIALALFKLLRFAEVGAVWNLRSPCKLEVQSLTMRRVEGFELPKTSAEIAKLLPELISEAATAELFDRDSAKRVRKVAWAKKKEVIEIELPKDTPAPAIPEELKKLIKWAKATKAKAPKLILSDRPDASVLEKVLALFASESAKSGILEKLGTDPDHGADADGDDGETS